MARLIIACDSHAGSSAWAERPRRWAPQALQGGMGKRACQRGAQAVSWLLGQGGALAPGTWRGRRAWIGEHARQEPRPGHAQGFGGQVGGRRRAPGAPGAAGARRATRAGAPGAAAARPARPPSCGPARRRPRPSRRAPCPPPSPPARRARRGVGWVHARWVHAPIVGKGTNDGDPISRSWSEEGRVAKAVGKRAYPILHAIACAAYCAPARKRPLDRVPAPGPASVRGAASCAAGLPARRPGARGQAEDASPRAALPTGRPVQGSWGGRRSARALATASRRVCRSRLRRSASARRSRSRSTAPAVSRSRACSFSGDCARTDAHTLG